MTIYHLYKKTITGKNGKSVKKWYYWYYDTAGKQIRKSCRDCKTKSEAQAFLDALPKSTPQKIPKVSELTETMYIPGSDHSERLIQYGKKLSDKTLLEARYYMNLISSVFGHVEITALKTTIIQKYLLADTHSGSWKNRFQTYICEVYQEAVWQGISVQKPLLVPFKRNSTRQSVLSTDEIDSFLQRKNFISEMFYLFFLVSLSAGLRLGETRALRGSQFIAAKKALIIDGFLSQQGVRNPFNKTGSIDNPRFRVVIIPDITVQLLEAWIDRNILDPADYIFMFNDKPVRTELAEKEFKRALTKAGISTEGRKLTPHALRYTYVTRTRRLLGTEHTMLMAGHMDEQMTDHYTRFQLEETIKQLQPIQASVNRFFE